MRPVRPLHGQRALGPRPRRDHEHARQHDPRGPRPGPATSASTRCAPRPGASRHPARPSTPTPNPPSQEPLRDHCRRPRAGDPRPARRARGAPRPRDPPGDRPHDPQGRDPRDHGPQRLRQDDALVRADGSPGVRGHRRRGPLEGLRPAQAVRRQARPARAVPRLPVPDRDPRPVGGVVRPQRAQRQAPGHRQEPRHRPHRHDPRRRLDARLPAPDAREDGASSRWRTASRPGTSTTGSRAARRSGSRCSRWRCSSRSSRSSTRPTRASTSTRSGSSPRA